MKTNKPADKDLGGRELLDVMRNYDFTIVNLNKNTLSLTSDSLDDPEGAILGESFDEVLTGLKQALIEQGEPI